MHPPMWGEATHQVPWMPGSKSQIGGGLNPIHGCPPESGASPPPPPPLNDNILDKIWHLLFHTLVRQEVDFACHFYLPELTEYSLLLHLYPVTTPGPSPTDLIPRPLPLPREPPPSTHRSKRRFCFSSKK